MFREEEPRDAHQVVHLEDLSAKVVIVSLTVPGVYPLQTEHGGQHRPSAGPTHKVYELVDGLPTELLNVLQNHNGNQTSAERYLARPDEILLYTI